MEPDRKPVTATKTGVFHEDAMTRELISFDVADLSAFARSLRKDLSAAPALPGHLALMNMVARAAGFQNVQHLRAGQSARPRGPAVPAPPAATPAQMAAVLRHFDAQGRLMTWPAKTSLQHLAVRALWARVPPRVVMSEREISAVLTRWHGFGDAPILRRTMVELRLVTRSADCRAYQRVEAAPTPDARDLIALLAQRAAVPEAAPSAPA